jgi:hypothetical protein
MDAQTPLLSIVILTDEYATIRRVTEHLCAQTLARSVELVLVCPRAADCVVPEAASGALARVIVVEQPLLPMGEARAAGVLAATAPIVALGETHAFPAPGWAERMVRAHAGPWDAVSPGIVNANPRSAKSWGGLLLDYGSWLAEWPPSDIPEPPTYNAVWKRAALAGKGLDLAHALEPGGSLDARFPARGERFRLEPDAQLAHLNVVPTGDWVAERYLGGRLFGAQRSKHWPAARRLLYCAGSALTPFIRFVRVRPILAIASRRGPLPAGTRTAVVFGCLLWALGEAIGYLAGPGRAESLMLEYELHKERYA